MRLGCPPHRIVFAFAINAGVEVNGDSFDELQIIRGHAEELLQSNFIECTRRFAGDLPRFGLRVNRPLGAGSNECLSVSTVHSKFGVPLAQANRKKGVDFFLENPWMTGLHCHVGSQGCSLNMLARDVPLEDASSGSNLSFTIGNLTEDTIWTTSQRLFTLSRPTAVHRKSWL